MQQPDPSETGQGVAGPTPAGRDAIHRVQPQASTQQRGRDSSRPYEHIPNGLRKDAHHVRFDWFAVGVVIIIAAIFAIAAYLNKKHTTSLIPVAVLRSTGCQLINTC